MDLAPPNEHQVLVFLTAFLVLLVAARVLGALAQRIGQPAVVGELAAGLLLGPSVLGRLAPGASSWLFPADDVQTAMLFTVAWLGVVFLLLTTGFETDLTLIRRLGRAAGSVSTGSLLVPVAFGLAIGLVMPEVFVGAEDRLVFALFMGAALSISSLPVIAKILTEMGLMRRSFGQLTLAAGMANDVVGWVGLGVIAGLVSAGTIELTDIVVTVVGVALFFGLAFTVGQRLIDALLRALAHADADAVTRTAVIVALALAGAATTQWLGVEAVLGAFVVGILIGRSPYRDAHVLQPVETATRSFLAPVFFATAGLRVDLGLLTDPTVAVWGLIVIAVASASKFIGAYVGSSLVGLPRQEGAALGVALNARGALEIVIAAVGLSLGVLNGASYTVVVLMAMATSMMAPPLLRRVLRGWSGTAEEQDRLRREEAMAGNAVVKGNRLLIPSRGGMHSLLAAQVADLAWPTDVPATVLTVGDAQAGHDLAPVLSVLAERDVTSRTVRGDDTARAILDEAKLGYGALVLGIADDVPDHGMPRFLQEIVAGSRIPLVIVRRARNLDRRTPWAFGRALVPVTGTRTARAAQEVAFGLSARLGTEIVIAHVVNRGTARRARAGDLSDAVDGGQDGDGDGDGESAIARSILRQASEQAGDVGARVQTMMRAAASPPDAILTLVDEVAADLVILGTSRRTVAGQAFLGHTVEEMLASCDATLVIVVTPDD